MRIIFFIFSIALIGCSSNAPEPVEPRVKDAEGIPVQMLTSTNAGLKYDNGEDFIITSMKGLTTDGINVLGWSDTDPVFVVNGDGVTRNIGDYGQGPGEYGRIPTAHISPMGIHIMDERNRIIFYQDDAYVSDFRLHAPRRVTFPMFYLGADEFIVADDFIITPTMVDQIGQIGTIYTHEGDRIGIITDPKFNRSHLEISPWSQRTHWAMHGDRIFVLYMYWGWLLELNNQFEIVKRTHLKSPFINRYLSEYLNADLDDLPVPEKSMALFHDFQIFRGIGYASTQRALHQIDLDTGKVTRMYQFRIDKGEFSEQPFVALPFFAMLENDTMLVGNSFLDYILRVDLPPEITQISTHP